MHESLASKMHTVCTAAIVALVTSCSVPNETPGEFIGLPDEGWEYGSTLTFNAAGDTLAAPIDHIDLSVRHTNDYPYANLWLEVSYDTADTTAVDTFDIRLADEYGKWLGSGSGPTIQHTQAIHPRQVPAPGSPFNIRHIMRVDRVNDIEQIGLTFVTK